MRGLFLRQIGHEGKQGNLQGKWGRGLPFRQARKTKGGDLVTVGPKRDEGLGQYVVSTTLRLRLFWQDK